MGGKRIGAALGLGNRLSIVLAGCACAFCLSWPAQAGPLGRPPAAPQAKKSVEEKLKRLAEELKAAESKRKHQAPKNKKAPANLLRTLIRPLRQTWRERMLEQRKRLLEDPKWRPTHEQIARFQLGPRLNNFCLDSQARILACCSNHRIHVLSQDGKLLESWELKFEPQAIGLCRSDGSIFVAGRGQLARLDASGKVLYQRQFPPLPSEEEIEQIVRKELKRRTPDYAGYVRGLKAQLADVEKRIAEEQEKQTKPTQEASKAASKRVPSMANMMRYLRSITVTGRTMSLRFKENAPLQIQRQLLQRYIAIYSARAKLIPSNPKERAERLRKQIQQRLREATYTSVAVSEKELFVICRGPDYYYNVWRLNHRLEEPKLIIKGLRGCCGQLDCRCYKGDLWIAANCEHKVKRYNREGELVASFGRRAREQADAFGGCCEPKNLCFGPDGFVYCAESGPPVCVKRFTLEGKFLNVVCFPVFKTGCVRVTVELAGEKVFLMSPNERAIYVFAPKKAEAARAGQGKLRR